MPQGSASSQNAFQATQIAQRAQIRESQVFRSAFDAFIAKLDRPQRDMFRGCTFQSVNNTIADIQHRHGAKRRAKNMNKAKAFIEALSQLSKVIEIFLNTSEILCFVWGPVKFVLVTASAHLETLDALLDTYAQIGDLLPNLGRLEAVYSNSPGVLIVLERYVTHVLTFHIAALQVFGRPFWKQFFKASWNTFKTSLSPIINDIKVTRDLLGEEKETASMHAIQDLRTFSEEQLSTLVRRFEEVHHKDDEKRVAEEEDLRRKQLECVLSKLNVPDYAQEHDTASEKRQASDSGGWALNDDTFRTWFDVSSTSHSAALYLSGIPGAGKTILASRIVDQLKHLQKSTQIPVVYFYFRDNDSDVGKSTIKSMLAAIIAQLAHMDSTILSDVFKDFSGANITLDLTIDRLGDLAKRMLMSYRTLFIVLDGLDECSDANKVISFFQDVIIDTSLTEGEARTLRVLFVGQRDGSIDKDLQSIPNLCELHLDKSRGHLRDIKAYATRMATKIQETFRLDEVTKRTILKLVVSKSDGMFLYAKVILENLLQQVSKKHVLRELDQSVFPQKLDDAYRRVVVRVLEEAAPPRRVAARQILGWVCCAARPLFWKEIQSRRCIDLEDPSNPSSDPDDAFVFSCKELCGSLVDTELAQTTSTCPESEQVVTLVHSTARSYLEENASLSIISEHVEMAIFCARYLTSAPFGITVPKEDQREHTLQGYYGFQDYAAAHWYDHVSAVASSDTSIPEDSCKAVQEGALEIFHHFLFSKEGKKLTTQLRDTLQGIFNLPTDAIDRGLMFDFQSRLQRKREILQSLQAEEFSQDISSNLQLFYGRVQYKCPRPWCTRFHTGFSDQDGLLRHIQQHERPFQCPHDNCFGHSFAFDNQELLARHLEKYHKQSDSERYPGLPWTGKLWQAASQGRLATVKRLVSEGADIDEPSNPRGKLTPLIFAIRNGHYDVCRYLLENGASPVGDGTNNISLSPMFLAIDINDIDMVRLLLDHSRQKVNLGVKLRFNRQAGTQILNSYITPLGYAAALGFNSILKYLASIDRTPDGLSTTHSREPYDNLHFACARSGDVETVRFLISIGNDVNARDEYGHSPLFYAVCRKAEFGGPDIEIVDQLLRTGRIPLDNTDKRSISQDFSADLNGPVARALIGAGVVFSQNNSGMDSGSAVVDSANMDFADSRTSETVFIVPDFNSLDYDAAGVEVLQNNPEMDSSMAMVDFANMDLANPLTSHDVLNDFDFDAFLHGDTDYGAFDFSRA